MIILLVLVITIISYIAYCKKHDAWGKIQTVPKVMTIGLTTLSGLQGLYFMWHLSAKYFNEIPFVGKFLPVPKKEIFLLSEFDSVILTIFMLALVVLSIYLIIKEIENENY